MMKRYILAVLAIVFAASLSVLAHAQTIPGFAPYSTGLAGGSTDANGHEKWAAVTDGPAIVGAFNGYNNSGSARYVMVFNVAKASCPPANGTAPVEELSVATASSFARGSTFNTPDRYSAGICLASSSTEGKLTLTSTADVFFHVSYQSQSN